MCLPRFQGKGYSEDFCKNMQMIKESVSRGEYELTEGCDDICRHCPNMLDGKCNNEDKVNKYDQAVKQAVENNEVPSPHNICNDCQWFYICKDIRP